MYCILHTAYCIEQDYKLAIYSKKSMYVPYTVHVFTTISFVAITRSNKAGYFSMLFPCLEILKNVCKFFSGDNAESCLFEQIKFKQEC